MKRKLVEEDFFGQVEWINRLPNSGGEWGNSILKTVEELEPELIRMVEQKKELEDRIKGVGKLLRGTVSRASKEAVMLFATSDIVKAKKSLEDNGFDIDTHGPTV